MLRLFVMLAWLGFVAACGDAVDGFQGPQAPEPEPAETTQPEPEPAPQPVPFEPQARPAVQSLTAQVDWDSARRDLAERPGEVERANFGIESGGSAPPVPVLLPTGIVTPQGAGEPAYRALSDGYYANYPGAEYDITISGSNRVYGTGNGTDVDAMSFARTAAGAQVALSRYGADYLVEFECKGFAGAQGDGCISEEDAMELARDLVIVGTR